MPVSQLIAAVIAILLGGAAAACGADSKCMLGERHYQISMPDGHDGVTPVGAVIWSHGYRGTAAGVMRNGSLRRLVSEAGLALIAVEAQGGGWDIPNNPRNMASTGEKELAYFDSVLLDAAARFPLDPSRLIAAGFSAGGMMTWNLACARPDRFAGFVPISGTFWKAPPDSCVTPVGSIVHIHGDDDKTVPLTGRVIGPTKQGQVAQAIKMYARIGAFGPVQSYSLGPLDCRNRSNARGDVLDFCMFDGGHSFRPEYLRLSLQILADAGKI